MCCKQSVSSLLTEVQCLLFLDTQVSTAEFEADFTPTAHEIKTFQWRSTQNCKFRCAVMFVSGMKQKYSCNVCRYTISHVYIKWHTECRYRIISKLCYISCSRHVGSIIIKWDCLCPPTAMTPGLWHWRMLHLKSAKPNFTVAIRPIVNS
jgi:hypothetical protein